MNWAKFMAANDGAIKTRCVNLRRRFSITHRIVPIWLKTPSIRVVSFFAIKSPRTDVIYDSAQPIESLSHIAGAKENCNIVVFSSHYTKSTYRALIAVHQLNRILQLIKHNKNKFLMAFAFFPFRFCRFNSTRKATAEAR